jgi:hypothetical protein
MNLLKSSIRLLRFVFMPVSLLVFGLTAASAATEEASTFDNAAQGEWITALEDPGTGDWSKHWFLDGEIASAENTPDGLHLAAGPRFGEDAHHMVLWTKESFAGDVRIDFDYTRTDFAERCVNIIYIQATGSGQGPYAKDIREWADLRTTPTMSHYFLNMNLYHISFAAFGNDWKSDEDYVRARRYLPALNNLRGSELKPDYSKTGLFEPGVPHRIRVIKTKRQVVMRVQTPERTAYFRWDNQRFPPVNEGRIGFRLMYTRSALLRNIEIAVRPQ